MEEYVLQSDEVVLFKGDAFYGNQGTSCEIIQTNINLIVIFKTKKMFRKENVEIVTFPMDGIKYFKDAPQVKQKGSAVELSFSNAEVLLAFSSKSSANHFFRSVMEALTEDAIPPRAVGIVKDAIGVVDNTLGINTVETVVGVMGKGVAGTILGEITKKALGSNQTGKVPANNGIDAENKPNTSQATGMDDQTKASQTLSIDEQIEALKKLKDLLDSGIITEEEFNIKKSQIMGL